MLLSYDSAFLALRVISLACDMDVHDVELEALLYC
jgi:hypothetical protein